MVNITSPRSGFIRFVLASKETKLERQEEASQFPMPKVRLITFGAGTKHISRAVQRLAGQAEKFPWIDEVRTYSEADLPDEYFSQMGDILASNPKGFGLWSWKPFLIERELDLLNPGDILLYLDAGVEINKKGASRFTYYLDHLARKDMLLFQLDHQHRNWAKRNAEIFDLGDNFFRNQVVAGILMFRVSDKSKSLVSRWKQLCTLNYGALLEDPIPLSNEVHPQLIEHRHDQSLLSKAVFEAAIETWPDETIFRPWRRGQEFPFLALRNKSSRWSWLPWVFNTPFIVWRLVYVFTNPNLRSATLRRLANKIVPRRP
jgi:hypothetical protein